MLTVPSKLVCCNKVKGACASQPSSGIQQHVLELGQNDAFHMADHRIAFGVDVIPDNVEHAVPKASTFHVMFVTNNKQLELIELWVGSVSCVVL